MFMNNKYEFKYMQEWECDDDFSIGESSFTQMYYSYDQQIDYDGDFDALSNYYQFFSTISPPIQSQ